MSQSKCCLYWDQLTISSVWWGRWCFASEWRKRHALPNGLQVCPGKSDPASVWPACRPSCRSWWQPPRSRWAAGVSCHRYGAWGPFSSSLNSHFRLLSDAKGGHFQILWWVQIVCLILKMLVSEGYHFFKTTPLWVLFGVRPYATCYCFVYIVFLFFFFYVGCDISTSTFRKRIMTPLPMQVTLSHASQLKTSDTIASWPCECSSLAQRLFPLHHLFMLQTCGHFLLYSPLWALSMTTVTQIQITPSLAG